MREVAVIGTGLVHFGELWERSLRSIWAEAALAALADAGVDRPLLVLEVIPPFEQDDDGVLADMVASSRHWQAHVGGPLVAGAGG